MEDHVLTALQIIQRDLRRHAGRIVVLWSGGKDSTVMLHLARKVMPTIQAVHYSEPWFPRKNHFIHRVAEKWNVTLFTPDPAWQSVYQQPDDDKVALVSSHHIGGDKGLTMPKDVLPYRASMKDGDWICGIDQHLHRPTAKFNWPWPAAFIGQKDGDVDPILGRLDLDVDYVENEGAADFSFPIQSWTDDQVWDYIEAEKVFYDHGKYLDRKPRTDKTRNTDYTPACVRCLDRTAGESVICPKTGGRIPNVSDRVPRTESLVHPYYTPERAETPEPVLTDAV